MVRLSDRRNEKQISESVWVSVSQWVETSIHTSTTSWKAALHYDSQVDEHVQCPAVLYRKNQHIDKQQSKQEVDKMDNQVA